MDKFRNLSIYKVFYINIPLTIAQCVSWKHPFCRVSVLDKRVFPRLGFKKPPVRADPFCPSDAGGFRGPGSSYLDVKRVRLETGPKRLKSSIAHEGIKPPSTPKFLTGKGLHIERNFIETLAYIIFSGDEQIISGRIAKKEKRTYGHHSDAHFVIRLAKPNFSSCARIRSKLMRHLPHDASILLC